MMVHCDANGNVLWFGTSLIDRGDIDILDVDIPLLMQPGLKKLVSGRITVTPVQVTTPTTSAPDIGGLIKALLNSQSIDQSTKTALIAALKGM